MADNCLEFIFQYGGGFKSYATQSTRIRFQHSVCDKFIVGPELGFFGIRLYPHAVKQLLDIPSSEVTNLVMDFSNIFKQEGRDISDQMYNASGTTERAALISEFLSRAVWLNKKTDPVAHIVQQVVLHEGQVDMTQLWQSSGLSIKQFERRFKAIAGFPPKYFARICRFQGAKSRYNANPEETMTGLAYTCNYFDQSHFIREFKEFSGIQPLRYFKLVDNGAETRLPCGWFV